MIDAKAFLDAVEQVGERGWGGEFADAALAELFDGGGEVDEVEGGLFVGMRVAQGREDLGDAVDGAERFELDLGGFFVDAGRADGGVGGLSPMKVPVPGERKEQRV